MIEAILLAAALAMDATAVAAGRAVTGMRRRVAIVLATSFGVFQAGMAAIGWAWDRARRVWLSGGTTGSHSAFSQPSAARCSSRRSVTGRLRQRTGEDPSWSYEPSFSSLLRQASTRSRPA